MKCRFCGAKVRGRIMDEAWNALSAHVEDNHENEYVKIQMYIEETTRA